MCQNISCIQFSCVEVDPQQIDRTPKLIEIYVCVCSIIYVASSKLKYDFQI